MAESALSAPIGTLVQQGVVPSAEVLAELAEPVLQLVAASTARAYGDETLRALRAANYRAFRNRLSRLLLNLERQVRVEELPWVRAVSPSMPTARRPTAEPAASWGGARAALDAVRAGAGTGRRCAVPGRVARPPTPLRLADTTASHRAGTFSASPPASPSSRRPASARR
ncbi:hypothetical protein [Streptomyces sp. T12]|uniref:hypothetical protein n=1 Tax=Streptomyces sp. T12 TaxID=477697 RepID=UPI0035A39A8B